MCDDRTEHDNMMYELKRGGLTRRGFGLAAMGGAGLMAALPRAAYAVDVTEMDVTIETPDGECDAYFVHPVSGPAPAVLVWPDIMGLRPAFRQMGKRLAEEGYAVLTVNPFYRAQPSPVIAEGEGFQTPGVRDRLFALMGALTPETHVSDAAAFVGWLDAQDAVDTSKRIGTTGYCMGGPIVMRTMASQAARVGAGGSFHGGGLATDQPNSPHLLIPQMQGALLIAIAENDDAQDPAAKDTLRAAFDAADVPAEIEVYAAQHGWCVPDSQVYDEAEAERAWARLLELFRTNLV